MLEDNEIIETIHDSEGTRDKITETGKKYVSEVIPFHNELAIVGRIDEVQNCHPPKAIDADKEIATIIEPVKEEINPIYLEAPADSVQIEQAAEAMEKIEGLSFKDWKNLSFEQRVAILQLVEGVVAEITHRPSCAINTKKMGSKNYGYFSPSTGDITLNSRYIKSDSYADYKECLDTVIHEGRHAYQHYNLTQREVHPREGDLANWKSNEFEYGYQSAQINGFKSYWLQPQECDARAFAEDVLKKYLEE